MIFGERLVQAREILGKTQTELAERISVTQSAVAHIEAGRVQPSEFLMERISAETTFPTIFFERPPSPHFPLGTLQFRARRRMTMTQKRQAYQYARLSFELFERLSRNVALPPVRLQPHSDSPATLAAFVRSVLGVADESPIENLVMLLERAGITVLALPLALPDRDGFSGWADSGRRPVIVLPAHDEGDRGRFTMAHELGELLYAALPPDDERERKADEFASNLLLPPSALRREFPGGSVTLTGLASAKKRWKISMQAVAYAAKREELVTQRHFRTLMQQISAKGWRMREPISLRVSPERPRALRKIVELKYGENPNYSRMERDVGLNAFMLREMIEAYASPRDPKYRRSTSQATIHQIRSKEDLTDTELSQ